MRLQVHHRTHYVFSQPQARLVQLLRLTPASHEGQNVVSWRIDACRDARMKRQRDGYGNLVTMLYVEGPLTELTLTVTGEVVTEDRAGVLAGEAETLSPLYFTQTTVLTAPSPELVALAGEIGEGEPLAKAHALNTLLHERMTLLDFAAEGEPTAAEAFAAGEGIARDLVHCFIAVARVAGFPARYVSGHRYDPDATEATSHSGHAWAEVYVEGYGWVGFDPAHDMCPTDAYVRVAIGLDHREAAPLSGQRTGGGHEHLAVDVAVLPAVQGRVGQ
ncbi:transglutaminase family protein [Sphingomonas naphthae]|uniref:Transglutaminase family protein n=1 Tax=Sphingomonas naphthae TaxID=1813468 RepID=A0ABY7TJS1_9SPHN|nr:transglutaminase family protein [Sphingomonas naphthae]WCT73472.1 transglutaminase family protein [Sphingomonas naphthae]